MTISRPLLISLLLLLLTACSLDRQRVYESEARFPAGSSIVDIEGYVKSTHIQAEETIRHGPQLNTGSKQTLKRRQFIHQDPVTDYTSIRDQRMSGDGIFPISINVENVELGTVFSMISTMVGMNIIVGDEVKGTVSIRLKDIPWDKVLDNILKIKKLAKHVDNESGIIRIHSQESLVAQEEFDRKRAEDAQKNIDAQRALEPLRTEIFRLYYADPEDVKTEIESILGSAGEGGEGATKVAAGTAQVVIDERTRSLVVKARSSELDQIHEIIKRVDIRNVQVLIEAIVVNATDNFLEELGSRLGFDKTGTAFGGVGRAAGIASGELSKTIPPAIGFGDTASWLGNNASSISDLLNLSETATGGIGLLISSGTQALKLELSALEKEGLSKTVANPKVFTLNNKKALIKQGDKVPKVTPASGSEPASVSYEEANLLLEVTPSIVGDGNIVLEIKLNWDVPDDSKAVQGNPYITQRVIETELLVPDKAVVVIGGIKKQETADADEKVPGLGDLPFIGQLFRKGKVKDNRTELLVFISPRVI